MLIIIGHVQLVQSKNKINDFRLNKLRIVDLYPYFSCDYDILEKEYNKAQRCSGLAG